MAFLHRYAFPVFRFPRDRGGRRPRRNQSYPLKGSRCWKRKLCPETVRELIGLKADATQKVVQTDNPYEIQTENADGSGQGTLFAAPVKYVDEDGQIRFIDSSIVRKGFFRSLFQSYTYTNAANSVQVEYSPESAKGRPPERRRHHGGSRHEAAG